MKSFFIILGLFFSTVFYSQLTDQDQIVKDTKAILQNMETKNYDGLLNFTYPSVFEKIDKAAFKTIFKNLFEGNEALKMDVLDLDKTKFLVSKVYSIDDKTKYAFVSYPLKMKMVFPTKIDGTSKQMMENLMSSKGMKAHFLNDNILEIRKLNLTIALLDKNTNQTWKYLNYDNSNPLLLSAIPNYVIKIAKQYYAEIQKKENVLDN